MLDTLITSKTRKKLLLKFFLNSSSNAYLRNLEHELDEAPNALRVELSKFEEANMLLSEQEGNKKVYRANIKHPLFNDIRNIMLKTIGFDQIIEKVISQLGDLHKVFVTGSFAKGIDSNIIDLVFVGDNINREYLVVLIAKTEKLINRRIRYLAINLSEINDYIIPKKQPALLLWVAKA